MFVALVCSPLRSAWITPYGLLWSMTIASTRFVGGTQAASTLELKSADARSVCCLGGRSPGFECEATRSYQMVEGFSISTCCMTLQSGCMENEVEVPLMQANFADSLSIQDLSTQLTSLSENLQRVPRAANISICEMI